MNRRKPQRPWPCALRCAARRWHSGRAVIPKRRVPPVVLLVLALGSVLGWSRAAGAQPAIASDRPGLGTGAFVLKTGTTHLEAGAELAIDGERQFSAGQIVVRWGLPFGELQALVNSFVVSRSPDQAAEGFEDLGLGLKIPLVAREDDSLRISVLASLSLPTGSRSLTSDAAVPAVALLVDRAVYPRVVETLQRSDTRPVRTPSRTWCR